MIQVREFFTELECFDGNTWTVKRQVDTQINEFIKRYSDSIKEIIDIEYQTVVYKDCVFASALLIYKV